MDFAEILQILDSTLRLATPLLLVCLAGLFSERAGIFDIGLEGKLLASAFMSAAVASMTGDVWLGLLAGIAASLVLAAIHGVASITFRGNQLISGVAINFLASGLTVVIGEAWFSLGGRTPQLEGAARFQEIALPFAEALRDVPGAGPGLRRRPLGPFDPRLRRARLRARSAGGCCSARGSGCVCARWGRTRRRWTRRASASSGCAMRR